MNIFSIDKKLARQKNREATIKHYVLGCILECAVKEDVMVTSRVRRLLVHELKIITEDTFINCLRVVRINRLFGINGTKKNYRALKSLIELVKYEKGEQIEIMKKLQEFAKNYENGLFINSKICESSFVDVKYNS